jgi:hypothetical protein
MCKETRIGHYYYDKDHGRCWLSFPHITVIASFRVVPRRVKIEEPENGLDALRAELTLKGALHVGKQLIPLSSDQIVAFSYLSSECHVATDGAGCFVL